MFTRIRRFWDGFLNGLNPLRGIHQELAIIRELYELQLSYHSPPIYRITQEPGKSDTEVTNMNDPPTKKSAAQELLDEWEED